MLAQSFTAHMPLQLQIIKKTGCVLELYQCPAEFVTEQVNATFYVHSQVWQFTAECTASMTSVL